MKKKGITLTSKNIEGIIKKAKEVLDNLQDPVWIEARKWYESETCKEYWGFNPTKKELDWAEKTNGYIRRRLGVKLYLNKYI